MLRTLLGLTLAALVTLTGCSKSGKVDTAKYSGTRKLAPDFELTDQFGKPVSLASLKGKVVLLNFWATWCGPCKVEIPWFMEFQQTYKGRDFVVLGVSFDDDGWKSVKPYMQDKRINYRVAIGNDDVAKLYGGVESLPTTLLIDKSGREATRHVGLVSKGDYKAEIENLLDENLNLNASVR